jgi:adenylate kinase
MQQKPLTRDQLRALSARSRGNAELRALLREVKRLRSIILETHTYYCRIARYTEDLDERAVHEAYFLLIEDEPVINEAMPKTKVARDPDDRRYPHMSAEREAKLLSRERR